MTRLWDKTPFTCPPYLLVSVRGFLYLTENGIADEQDKLRPQFINEGINHIAEIIEDGSIDLRGYLHWSLNDNYEWAEGFNMKFGLFSVDSNSKKRFPRKSVKTYKKIINRYKIEG